MSIETTARVVRQAGLMTTSVDDDLIILNMKTSNYIALDEIGRRIWDLIEMPALVCDVCAQLSTEFNAPGAQIEADVIAFLDEMLTEELVHVVGQ